MPTAKRQGPALRSPLPFAAVAVVCRARDDLAGLDHIAATITDFLDASSCWTLSRAVAQGHLSLLHRLYSAGNTTLDDVDRAIELAADKGRLDIVRFLHEHFPDRHGSWAIEVAAAKGHLEIVQWLHEHSKVERFNMSAMDDAAANGHLAVVQWLHANRAEGCTTRAMDCAARGGRLDVVKWLHEHRREGCTTQAMDWAATNGHLEVVQWLHAHRREGCSSMAIDGAASNGHLHVVLWLHANKQLKCTHNAVHAAAVRGHSHVSDWLKESMFDESDSARENPVAEAEAASGVAISI